MRVRPEADIWDEQENRNQVSKMKVGLLTDFLVDETQDGVLVPYFPVYIAHDVSKLTASMQTVRWTWVALVNYYTVQDIDMHYASTPESRPVRIW